MMTALQFEAVGARRSAVPLAVLDTDISQLRLDDEFR